MLKTTKHKKYRKASIPKALREQVWSRSMGLVFSGKCVTTWCKNTISVFDFQCGHNIPESRGGATTIDNLFPICCRCNMSMGNKYTFTEWCTQFKEHVPDPPKRTWTAFLSQLFGCVKSTSNNRDDSRTDSQGKHEAKGRRKAPHT